MFSELIKYPIQHENLNWQARLIIRKINDQNCLLLRLKLMGAHFLHKSTLPFVQLDNSLALVTEIEENGQYVYAYFDRLPSQGTITFGYGDQQLLAWPELFDPSNIELLDLGSISTNVSNLNQFNLSGNSLLPS